MKMKKIAKKIVLTSRHFCEQKNSINKSVWNSFLSLSLTFSSEEFLIIQNCNGFQIIITFTKSN